MVNIEFNFSRQQCLESDDGPVIKTYGFSFVHQANGSNDGMAPAAQAGEHVDGILAVQRFVKDPLVQDNNRVRG